eukprot:CAMPEP_0175984866 /NCGR_PEP_ID=MMETSP0108-20121206/49238_1 /TAXON_ID=195067 ORGANISM="Goniomonas pacifica, Strain CCMP1869" /NCGR_SAMPLE_ID=MMETSP0108 /ASSEMBLY_ACC=CAM_ASM_000204 /LENGTH=137 /DNA_ID=CAMNT_0017315773 /DNA_START=98 /DNA_END=512 /DNA_ORIENTATION=-
MCSASGAVVAVWSIMCSASGAVGVVARTIGELCGRHVSTRSESRRFELEGGEVEGEIESADGAGAPVDERNGSAEAPASSSPDSTSDSEQLTGGTTPRDKAGSTMKSLAGREKLVGIQWLKVVSVEPLSTGRMGIAG